MGHKIHCDIWHGMAWHGMACHGIQCMFTPGKSLFPATRYIHSSNIKSGEHAILQISPNDICACEKENGLNSNVGLLLEICRKQWPNIKPTLMRKL